MWNYIKDLEHGTTEATTIGEDIMAILVHHTLGIDLDFGSSQVLKEKLSRTKDVLLTVFNPSTDQEQVVKIPVKDGRILVQTVENGKQIQGDVICEKKDIHTSPTHCFLYFVDQFKALQVKFYLLKYSNANIEVRDEVNLENNRIQNDYQEIEVKYIYIYIYIYHIVYWGI